MAARSMKGALGASLKAEEQAVKDRFQRAETALARGETPPPVREAPEEPRVKRDSFTMPLADYARIARLQKRCLGTAMSATKSEILRAGLAALDALSDEEIAAIVGRLEKVKTGRRPLSSE